VRVREDKDDAVCYAADMAHLCEVDLRLTAGRIRVIGGERDAVFKLKPAASVVDVAYCYANFVGNFLGATEPLPELDELIVGE